MTAPVRVPYEWQVAEQVQPTAQRHDPVAAWMAVWDVWSRVVVDGFRAGREEG